MSQPSPAAKTAALTLALAGAFAVLPATTANAAYYDIDSAMMDGEAFDFQDVSIEGDKDTFLDEETLDEGYSWAYGVYSDRAGTATLKIKFLKPENTENIGSKGLGTIALDADYNATYQGVYDQPYNEYADNMAAAPASLEGTYELKFDEQGKLVSLDGGALDSAKTLLAVDGPIESVQIDFTADAQAQPAQPERPVVQPA